ncbi:MAG TPA: hypothetical protein VM165_20120 [Planctomycetaceae bacterium]|nr:hypothetical protein [Planctomycetaceae bacterium]
MSEQQPDELETAGATAKVVVDHLIAIASGAESDEWLAQYVAVQKALAAGRFKEAVREHSRLVDCSIQPKWVSSCKLKAKITDAMSNLARELKLPNPGKKPIRLDDLPSSIEELGTIAGKDDRMMKALAKVFRDPWDDDPRYREILAAASAQAEAELENHPMKGGLGFCHVVWERQKEILRQTYGLKWQSPPERLPGTIFD